MFRKRVQEVCSPPITLPFSLCDCGFFQIRVWKDVAYTRVADAGAAWSHRGSGYVQFELVPDRTPGPLVHGLRGLAVDVAASVSKAADFISGGEVDSDGARAALAPTPTQRHPAWADDAAAAAEDRPTISSCHWLQFVRSRHFDADGALMVDLGHGGRSSQNTAEPDGGRTRSAPTQWLFTAINAAKTFLNPPPSAAATCTNANGGPPRYHVHTASGSFKQCNEWYLDAFWVHGGEFYYDDGGMSNRTATELSIFDGPSISRPADLAEHTDRSSGAPPPPPLLSAAAAAGDVLRAGESEVEFLTFLVWHGRPLWEIAWRLVRRADGTVEYEVLRGGAVSEFPVQLQTQRWRLGYAEHTAEGELNQPIDVPSLCTAGPSPDTS